MRITLVGLLAMLGAANLLMGAESISRTYRLPTMAMDQYQLAGLVESINHFIRSANGQFEKCKSDALKVEASDSSTTVKFNADEIRNELPRLPKVFFDLQLRYSCYSYDIGPAISEFNLNLSDSDTTRAVVVEGFQPDQAEALASMVVMKLEPLRKVLTGITLRIGLSTFITVLLFLTPLLIGFLRWQRIAFPGQSLLVPLSPVMSIGGMLCWIFLPALLTAILPGFAVYSGEVSFIRRYTAEITFAGFLLTVVGLILTLRRKSRTTPRVQAQHSGEPQEDRPDDQPLPGTKEPDTNTTSLG